MSSPTNILSLLTRCLRAAAVALSPLLFISCGSDDNTPAVSSPVGTCQVGFDIVVDGADNPAATRATRTPEGEYAPGEGYENYINIPGNDFRFLFFTADDKYIGRVRVESIMPTSTLSSSKRYYVLGGIDKDIVDDIVGHPVKIVTLANWGSENYDKLILTKGVTTIDDVCNAGAGIYTYIPNGFPSASNPIPLYGVTNAMTLDFDALNLARIGTIHLLRAVAKVELELTRASGQVIEWVKLSRYNTQGYCAPTGIRSQNDYVHGNYDDDYANTPHTVTGTVSAEPLTLTKMSDTRYLIYVPEFDITSASADSRAQLLVKFQNDTKTYHIDFKYYIEPPVGKKLNDPFDILRNYWYKFSLATSPLRVTVQVVPYDEIPLEPEFGLLRDPNWVPVYDENVKVTYWYDSETGQYYNEKLQPIPNPFWGKDPVKGWSIIRSEENGEFLYYYDGETGKYYNDKYEEIPNPYDNTDERGFIKIKDKDGNILYYFDDEHDQYYNRFDRPIPNPYSNTDPDTGWLLIRNKDAEVLYYYDETNDQYYDKDKKPIDNPFVTTE